MSTIIRCCRAALLAGLATGCSLFHDAQTDTLDVGELDGGEGYVVGTFTTVERHTRPDLAPVSIVSPDVDYTVIVREAHEPIGSDELASEGRETLRAWDISVEGEDAPALFALRLPIGRHHLECVELQKGNKATSAPICLDFEVTPRTVTYIGDVLLELNTTESLFSARTLRTVRSEARDDLAQLKALLAERFPEAPPTPRVAIATFSAD